jgi:hypothetical protein
VTTYEEEIKKSRERFDRETRSHELEVLHNKGLYRHLRMKNPRTREYWYDVITWPGNLVVRGDYGETYVFSRTTDMFEFFAHELGRDGSISINPHYWAEKLTSHDVSRKYDDDVFREEFKQQAEYLIENEEIEPDQVERFRREIESFLEDEDYFTADAAIRAVGEFQFWNDEKHEHSYEYRHEAITFEDCYEWIGDCTVYEWGFLWACHAIMLAVKEFYALYGRPLEPVNHTTAGDTAYLGVTIG